ncbi:hypothetical protein DICSQDRAFT_168928 [Dichomitus squalens LYAD-421 SS1]|uniref:uncharacterized protein n=1 Tax=Dichomitus squalens (strain LYAD-421) TaxID=732165 RepID=UPI0004412D7E|nr:uncharacterized protein DICSQDRAFT_168928 [Dichomitus squalens LYAD-421 SS1]EJF62537.1 hypothetical protein DICSQDRAFT_168928 [Dichomitus squalens LYAD-421 SS1]
MSASDFQSSLCSSSTLHSDQPVTSPVINVQLSTTVYPAFLSRPLLAPPDEEELEARASLFYKPPNDDDYHAALLLAKSTEAKKISFTQGVGDGQARS